MAEKFKGKRYSLSGVYFYCKKIGLKKAKPRPVHIKNDPKQCKNDKKIFSKLLKQLKLKILVKKFLFIIKMKPDMGKRQ